MNSAKYVLGIFKSKCYKLLMSSIFVVWFVNDIAEPELYFLYKYLSLKKTNRAKYVSK